VAPAIKIKIAHEKLSILFRNLLTSIPANFLCATIIFISLHKANENMLFVGWYLAVILFSIVRSFSLYFYYKAPQRYLLHLTIFMLGTLCSAILWGIADSYLMPPNQFFEQMIIIIIVAGITSGGLQTLQPNLVVGILYLTFIILPLCSWIFLQPYPAYFIMGVAVCVYLSFMVVTCFRGYKMLDQMLKLRYENSELVDDLFVSNKKLQDSYHSIEKSEETLRNIQEHAPIGMATISLAGKLLQVNHGLCDIIGYTKDELQDIPTQTIIYSNDVKSYLETLKNLKLGKLISSQSEKRLVHKDGQAVWVLVNMSLVYNPENEPLFFIAQIQDINDRKLNEDRVNELNERTKSMLSELQQREHEMVYINKMNDMLQTCQESNEAYAVIHHSAQELFPAFSGALAIYDKNNRTMETMRQWGSQKISKKTFGHHDCWGLREGHSYIVNQPDLNLVCRHFEETPIGSYICLPLIIQTGVFGMLVLLAPGKNMITHYLEQLTTTFSEVLRLSLANIKLRETLHQQATHDALTGLYNRRYLDEMFPAMLEEAIQQNRTLCVCMLDIDHFKMFNDTSGHGAGDQVLMLIGGLLKDSFRGNDIACRFGGEEFILILTDTNLSNAILRLEQIRTKVKDAKLSFQNSVLPAVTISIGIAEAPMHGESVADVIHKADEALYRAKLKGRDRIEVAD